MTCGIYKLTFASGRIYIGSSLNIEARFREHSNLMRTGKHRNRVLVRAFKVHGIPTLNVLLRCSPENRLMYEQLCLDKFMPEYNCSKIAGKVEMTPEVRMKISKANLNPSQETRDKMSLAKKGKPLSKAHVDKLKLVRVGQRPMLGKKHSEENKLKFSLMKIGKKMKQETIEKIRIASTGKKHTSEAKWKMSLDRVGKYGRKPGWKQTEEVKMKMSLSAKRRKARENSIRSFERYQQLRNDAWTHSWLKSLELQV